MLYAIYSLPMKSVDEKALRISYEETKFLVNLGKRNRIIEILHTFYILRKNKKDPGNSVHA